MPLRGRSNLTEEKIFFVTTTVVRFINVFADEKVCDILIENIKSLQERYNYSILAYVIMPSHFHWIVVIDPEKGTISDIMRDIKRNSSKDLTKYLENKPEYNKVFKKEAMIYRDQYKKLWMKRFDDEVIRNEKMFWQKLNYIHNNPVEAGIVPRPEDYKYSSARNYINGDHSLLRVDIEYTGVRIV